MGCLILLGLPLVVVAFVIDWPCFPAWVGQGVLLHQCPVGTPMPGASMEAWNLRRGAPGSVRVEATAAYSLRSAADNLSTPIRRYQAAVFLEDEQGRSTELEPFTPWEEPWTGARQADFVLPKVPDGDYLLRAVLDTPLGEVSVQSDLPLYAPALVHLATDRPLYKPGQTMKFRAVVLRTADLTPLDARPGAFTVTGPTGDVLLEERVPAGVFGVAAGDFPLADDAQVGEYTLTWRSGSASDSVVVRVAPFSLPRYQITSRTTQPWYTWREVPEIIGRVAYRSGAPVANAQVEVRLRSVDTSPERWPPPNAWMEAHTLTTSRDGTFHLTLSPVPGDLRTQASLSAYIVATDQAGERVTGSASLVLSATPIVAQVETELRDGLVPDFNNRVYVRVTTPDGRPLPGAQITVARAWDPLDEGVTSQADADSVAALQIDPGKPVSVTIPAPPYRAPPPDASRRVTRQHATDLLADGDLTLAERVQLDTWDPALETCADWVESGTRSLRVGVAVDAAGTVRRVVRVSDAVTDCVARQLLRQRGPSGQQHFYLVSWDIKAQQGSSLSLSNEAVPQAPSGLGDALEQARVAARPCIIGHERADHFPDLLRWRVGGGERAVRTQWMSDPAGAGAWRADQVACVRRAFSPLRLNEAAKQEAEGVARFTVRLDPGRSPRRQASATVRTTYELAVSASLDGQDLGETTVLVDPGFVPDLRLRPERSLLHPGDALRIKLLRGPDFHCCLPEADSWIHLKQGGHNLVRLAYDEDKRVISGTVPSPTGDEEPLHGLLTVEWSGARAVLLVPRQEELAVAVTPDKEVYRPGEQASLRVQTLAGSHPVAAAVSLFGVDEALSQLATLLGPDDWGRVTVRATSAAPAFGLYDARALLTGQVKGENAVLAALQRVSDIPVNPLTEEGVSTEDASPPLTEVPLVENFYQVLSHVRQQVAVWERDAPDGQTMTPRRMWDLWEATLRERRSAGLPCTDAFGEPLHLWRLSADLLTLTDPRLLVSDARRLPEDVENWQDFIQREAP